MENKRVPGADKPARATAEAPRLSLAAGTCTAGFILAFFGSGVVLLVASALMLTSLWALAKAADQWVAEASDLAITDPAWRAHVAHMRTFPLTVARL